MDPDHTGLKVDASHLPCKADAGLAGSSTPREKAAPGFSTGLLFLAAWLCLAFVPQMSRAAGAGTTDVGELVSVQGAVELRRAAVVGWQPVSLGSALCAGDTIRIGRNARAAILLVNETLLRLDQETTVTFSRIRADEPSWIDLLKGALHFISRTPKALEIRTPFVNAGIEGTEFAIQVDSDRAELWVFEGRVAFSNDKGKLSLGAAEAAVAEAGRAPRRRVVVRPRDAVQWALYYPPLTDYQAAVTGTAAQAIQDSLTAYETGDVTSALARLEKVPAGYRDAAYHTFRGALLLTVGRLEKAVVDFDRALAIDPDNGNALAWQSLIAVVRNETERGLALASRAAAADPQSTVAQTALSYAYQAAFDLDQALASAEKATRLDSHDALAWARLAELHLSSGELDRALEAAQKAVARNPRVSRTQSVLGFAYLTRVETAKARASFEKAIQLDQADPLPRLGMGLARVREGKLAEGRKEIEIATGLDPNDSLVRSYLGKAYFEEKRDPLAASQLAMAKELDPKDPTAWFYDAIRKQTENRPVEALEDLQRSIELNDNRAVYRSRLLLDDDLAARSAALGRIYNDLGFQQLGLVEGWKSVNADPSNYSAHRLLADNYVALPRHEIARVSELLQSQLLQPINITPVQPILAESNIQLLEAGGPSSLSFSEFNPLFARNRLTLQASGVIGSNDTFGDEVTLSGVRNKFSYSLGQFHYETDGFRENNDINVSIYNAYAQANISRLLNLQVELRYRDIETGDLESFFSVEDSTLKFQRSFREESNSDTFRLGFRISPSEGSDLLTSLIYLDEESRISLSPDQPATSMPSDGYLAETQYLYRRGLLNAILGAGYYDLKQSFNTAGFRFRETTKHQNYYLYSRVQLPDPVTWTLGLSYDVLDSEAFSEKRERTNPKIGMLWDVRKDTSIRAAWFRMVKRSPFFHQTLEPTQVAGFNQFFDDFTGTEAERWGIGIDHRFNRFFNGGAEFSERYLRVPIASSDGIELRWDESLYRAYMLFTPHPRWAMQIEYWREDFDNLESPGPSDTDTIIAPLGLSYFDPSGFFAKLRATYFDQEVVLGTGSDSDSATFLDLSLGYRLPQRLGILEVQLRNLLNQDYRYEGLQDRRHQERTGVPLFLPFPPEFTVSARLTLAF